MDLFSWLDTKTVTSTKLNQINLSGLIDFLQISSARAERFLNLGTQKPIVRIDLLLTSTAHMVLRFLLQSSIKICAAECTHV